MGRTVSLNGQRPDWFHPRCPWCEIDRHDACQPALWWCECMTGPCQVRLLNDEETQ